MDCNKAKCYDSDWDSYPCPQCHLPGVITNSAIFHLPYSIADILYTYIHLNHLLLSIEAFAPTFAVYGYVRIHTLEGKLPIEHCTLCMNGYIYIHTMCIYTLFVYIYIYIYTNSVYTHY